MQEEVQEPLRTLARNVVLIVRNSKLFLGGGAGGDQNIFDFMVFVNFEHPSVGLVLFSFFK